MKINNQSMIEKYTPKSFSALREYWCPEKGIIEFKSSREKSPLSTDEFDETGKLKECYQTLFEERDELYLNTKDNRDDSLRPAKSAALKEIDGYLDRLETTIEQNTIANPLPPETHIYQKDDLGNLMRPKISTANTQQLRKDGPLAKEQRFSDWCQQFKPATDMADLTLGDCVRSWLTGEHTELTQRTMSTTGTGGVLIPTLLSATVIDLARNKARVLQAGAITWPMDSKTLTLPRQLTDPQGGWRPELGHIKRTGLTFEPVVLKSCSFGALVTLSQELIEDSVGLDAFLTLTLSNVIAEGIDQASLSGAGEVDSESGERIEPIGVLNTDNVQAIDLSAAIDSYAPFSQAVTLVRQVNGEPGGLMMSPVNYGILDALTASDGQPLMPPPSWSQISHYDTNQLDDATAIVGDWSQLAVGIRHNIRLEYAYSGSIPQEGVREEVNLFSQNAVALRVLWRGDVAVQRPDQFVKITGMNPISVESVSVSPKTADLTTAA